MAKGTCGRCHREVQEHCNICEDCDRELWEEEQLEQQREDWERREMEEHYRRHPHG